MLLFGGTKKGVIGFSSMVRLGFLSVVFVSAVRIFLLGGGMVIFVLSVCLLLFLCLRVGQGVELVSNEVFLVDHLRRLMVVITIMVVMRRLGARSKDLFIGGKVET